MESGWYIPAGLGGWEQVWVVWMLAVFFKQEIDGRLWDGDFTDRIFCLRPADRDYPKFCVNLQCGVE